MKHQARTALEYASIKLRLILPGLNLYRPFQQRGVYFTPDTTPFRFDIALAADFNQHILFFGVKLKARHALSASQIRKQFSIEELPRFLKSPPTTSVLCKILKLDCLIPWVSSSL